MKHKFPRTIAYLNRRLKEKQLIEIELRKRIHSGVIESLSEVKYIGNDIFESGYYQYAPLASRYYKAYFKVQEDNKVIELSNKLECVG